MAGTNGNNLANGSAEAPIEVDGVPTVVGINFGNSYASIAVLNKEGQAECIANEDGERQIACAVSFHGEEIYIGNQAKQQLVKNAENTITGFRNLLGKKFSDVAKDERPTSAPVIQHPDRADEPAYRVKFLQPAPSPLPTASGLTTKTNTPTASRLATPRSEPVPSERVLTPSEATSIFLRSLQQSAEDFLGRKADGAVISVPSWFDAVQRDALLAAARDAGINVLQLLDEAGAAALTATTNPDASSLPADRTQLVVDLGANGLSLTLLAASSGLLHVLASSWHPSITGTQIDDSLIRFFAREFTKKTKTPLAVAPSSEKADVRAEAKLRLALEHTKRTVSASAGAATCSVESLKDGLDFTGTINRLRFDMEARGVYTRVASAVRDLLSSSSPTLDPTQIDEIVYVGGSACLPGLDAAIGALCGDEVVTPFSAGTVAGGGEGDPTTVVARGCALQAGLIQSVDDEGVRAAFVKGEYADVGAAGKTLGVVFPGDGEGKGEWVPLVKAQTALPARRAVEVEVGVGADGRVGIELWEATERVKIEMVKPPKAEPVDDDDEEEEEEEEEEEVKELVVDRETLLGGLELKAKGAKGRAKLQVQIVVGGDGGVALELGELGGEKVTLTVPAA